MAEAGPGAPSQRIDKYLWFARLAKSRTTAQKLAEEGHIRVNGRRIDRAHAPVRPGDLITFPHPGGARVVRVVALPPRRGPTVEAEGCYEELTVGG
jgi:ribosome-associated heat shock protein Hsp15